MSFGAEIDENAEQRHQMRITRCRLCRLKIIFLQGKNGLIPVDADEVECDDHDFDAALHVDHREVCSVR